MSDRYRNEHADKPGFIPATNTKDLPRVVAAMTTQMGPVATMEALLAKNEALRAQVAGLRDSIGKADALLSERVWDGIDLCENVSKAQVILRKALAEAAGA